MKYLCLVYGGERAIHTVPDGPFAETKEQLAGFYLIELRDLKKPSRWPRGSHRRAWGARRGAAHPADSGIAPVVRRVRTLA